MRKLRFLKDPTKTFDIEGGPFDKQKLLIRTNGQMCTAEFTARGYTGKYEIVTSKKKSVAKWVHL